MIGEAVFEGRWIYSVYGNSPFEAGYRLSVMLSRPEMEALKRRQKEVSEALSD